MRPVGHKEKKTQQRVVQLFREGLGYDYLGDWTHRDCNHNIEEDLLRRFLRELLPSRAKARTIWASALPSRSALLQRSATSPWMKRAGGSRAWSASTWPGERLTRVGTQA